MPLGPQEDIESRILARHSDARIIASSSSGSNRPWFSTCRAVSEQIRLGWGATTVAYSSTGPSVNLFRLLWRVLRALDAGQSAPPCSGTGYGFAQGITSTIRWPRGLSSRMPASAQRRVPKPTSIADILPLLDAFNRRFRSGWSRIRVFFNARYHLAVAGRNHQYRERRWQVSIDSDRGSCFRRRRR